MNWPTSEVGGRWCIEEPVHASIGWDNQLGRQFARLIRTFQNLPDNCRFRVAGDHERNFRSRIDDHRRQRQTPHRNRADEFRRYPLRTGVKAGPTREERGRVPVTTEAQEYKIET